MNEAAGSIRMNFASMALFAARQQLWLLKYPLRQVYLRPRSKIPLSTVSRSGRWAVSDSSCDDALESETIVNEIGDSSGLSLSLVDILPRPADIDRNYGKHPGITSTALAHSLWSYVLRPGKDTAIDATAGNGGDAEAIARMLFSDQSLGPECRLICIDIQEKACLSTESKLKRILPPEILDKHVQIIHGTHRKLPELEQSVDVGLIVYNLGFLPGDQQNRTTITQTVSTIESMTDAARLLRLGGMLSVMTYPRTNSDEHAAVRLFIEGLALFSSADQDWRDVCKSNEMVIDALQSVYDALGEKQTWRVHENNKLGWVDAPILLTAVRIK